MSDSQGKLVSAFVRATAVGIVLADERGRVILANEDAEELFGSVRRGLVGRALDDLVPGCVREPGVVARSAGRSGGNAALAGSRRVLVGRRLDGSHVTMEAELRAVVRDSRRLIVATLQRERAHDQAEHIAAMLNDTVVRRLYALGITLTADTIFREGDEVVARVRAAVDEIDRIIRLVRDTLFPRPSVDDGLAPVGPAQALASAPLHEALLGAYHVFFAHNSDGVLFAAADGRVLAANPTACDMLGASEESVRRAGLEGLADPLDERWTAAVEEGARTGSFHGELRLRRQDGSSFPVEITWSVFSLDGQERTSRMCIVFRDVSDRCGTCTAVPPLRGAA